MRLTLIELLLRPVPGWQLRPLVLLAAGLGLLFPRVLRTPAAWLAIALLAGLRVAAEWPLSDNHHYLLAYWCLAIGLALLVERPGTALARSARWLLAGTFLFATLWKGVLSPDYRDGRFFRVTLLTDERFARAVELFGGVSADGIAESREHLRALPAGLELAEPPRLRETPRLRRLAWAATWGTLAAECALALAFLLPWGRAATWLRHGGLIGFCAVTYAFAPVCGFGWLLATMGLGQLGADRPRWRAAYLATWFLILFYGDVPWARLALDWSGADA